MNCLLFHTIHDGSEKDCRFLLMALGAKRHRHLTTDFKHRRTAAFENQRLYGQIECAIGGCLQGIVRRFRLSKYCYLCFELFGDFLGLPMASTTSNQKTVS